MIVLSRIVWGETVSDKRRPVREEHIHDDGHADIADYMAEPGADAVKIMLGRVAELDAAWIGTVAARAVAIDRETLAAAKDGYFAAMSDADVKTTLKLPADFEIPKDG